MQIRAYQKQDQMDVIALWQRCGLVRSWNDPAKDIERKLAVQPDLFLVGCEGQQLIASAMAGYDGHRGNVYYLAVDPNCQARGYGRAMMGEVERLLQARGCPKLNILIRATNHEVRTFYERLGYSSEQVACMGRRLISDE